MGGGTVARLTSKFAKIMHDIRHTSTARSPRCVSGTSSSLMARLYCSMAKVWIAVGDEGRCSIASCTAPRATMAWRTADSWCATRKTRLSQNSDLKKPESWGDVRRRKKANERFDCTESNSSTHGPGRKATVILSGDEDDSIPVGTSVVVYPSHVLPVEVHRKQAGRASSHLTRLTISASLVVHLSLINLTSTVQWFLLLHVMQPVLVFGLYARFRAPLATLTICDWMCTITGIANAI